MKLVIIANLVAAPFTWWMGTRLLEREFGAYAGLASVLMACGFVTLVAFAVSQSLQRRARQSRESV
jgi:hypothetical protein